jgi:2-polyprenyl-3-methyl-5-hydroxy-6-metoxy-1,4-benzoquinol methylase
VAQCPVCDLVYTINWPNTVGAHFQLLDPEPSRANQNGATPQEEAEYWSDETIEKEYRLAPFHNREADLYLDILKQFIPHGKLLDVGCSLGLFLGQAAKWGYDVLGLEPSQKAVLFAKNTFGIEVLPLTFEESNFEDDSFDIITLLDVIEHQLDPLPMVYELYRILRPNGVLLIETPNNDCVYARLYRLQNGLNNLLRTISGQVWDKPWGGYYAYDHEHKWQEGHVLHFTGSTLERCFAKAGFKMIHLEKTYTDIDYLVSRQTSMSKRLILQSAFTAAQLLKSPNKLVAVFQKPN